MLRSVSKRAYRVCRQTPARNAARSRCRCADAADGPVSIEIPIDVQGAAMDMPRSTNCCVAAASSRSTSVRSSHSRTNCARETPAAVLAAVRAARRTGARAREARWGVVTSAPAAVSCPKTTRVARFVHDVAAGRGALSHLRRDVVVGSRLRGNETLRWNVKLPEKLYQIDADPTMRDRSYPVRRFVTARRYRTDELVELLGNDMKIDPAFGADIASAREGKRRSAPHARPYEDVVHALGAWMPADALWVRDVTVSNSRGAIAICRCADRATACTLWRRNRPRVTMAIGAALAAPGRKTVALAGDGGLQLSFGEFVTLVQEDADVLLIVMNDAATGDPHIQDDKFGGRTIWPTCTRRISKRCRFDRLASARAGDMASFNAALAALGNRKGRRCSKSTWSRSTYTVAFVPAGTRSRTRVTTAASALQPIFIGGAWRPGRGAGRFGESGGRFGQRVVGRRRCERRRRAVERGVAAMHAPAWRNLLPHERARISAASATASPRNRDARALATARQRKPLYETRGLVISAANTLASLHPRLRRSNRKSRRRAARFLR